MLQDIPLTTIDGRDTSLAERAGKALLMPKTLPGNPVLDAAIEAQSPK